MFIYYNVVKQTRCVCVCLCVCVCVSTMNTTIVCGWFECFQLTKCCLNTLRVPKTMRHIHCGRYSTWLFIVYNATVQIYYMRLKEIMI